MLEALDRSLVEQLEKIGFNFSLGEDGGVKRMGPWWMSDDVEDEVEDSESDLDFMMVVGDRGGDESDDGPADRDTVLLVVLSLLSTGPSNRQSIPCCFLSCAKLSLRASCSSFDLETILSG